MHIEDAGLGEEVKCWKWGVGEVVRITPAPSITVQFRCKRITFDQDLADKMQLEFV